MRLRNGWNLMNEKKGFVAVGCAKRFIGKPDIKAKFFFLYWLFANAGRHSGRSLRTAAEKNNMKKKRELVVFYACIYYTKHKADARRLVICTSNIYLYVYYV